ncbi:transcription elongation factor GreA [bacterium]|nr:MAG: transcription elongation factor GreA [bacterium]
MAILNEPATLVDNPGGIPLTPEGHAMLQKELDHLTSVKRPEIADRIRESQQHGEFSEDNNELDEVKFEQAMVENRISELKALFGSAVVLEIDQIPTDTVGIGSKVTVEDLQYGDEFEVRIVAGVEADPNKDLISMESPLGSSIYGHGAGVEVSFEAPEGKKRYKILSITR